MSSSGFDSEFWVNLRPNLTVQGDPYPLQVIVKASGLPLFLMEEQESRRSSSGGIAMIAFILAVGISMSYYQFFYVPEANRKPNLPSEVLSPPESIQVKIVEGSSLPDQARNFEPKNVRGTIGISNRIVWTSEDPVPHTVTSDNGYVDQINGTFDSLQQQEQIPGGFVKMGESFSFTFTKIGEYPYHCEPHPWMNGKVEIVENFA